LTSETPEDTIGFFDADGSWVTRQEWEQKFGHKLDHPVPEVWDDLADIDMLRVRRGEDGTPVTAQLTQFAVDLYELPEDADVGRVSCAEAPRYVAPDGEQRDSIYQHTVYPSEVTAP